MLRGVNVANKHMFQRNKVPILTRFVCYYGRGFPTSGVLGFQNKIKNYRF
jgi:hypothetical protein